MRRLVLYILCALTIATFSLDGPFDRLFSENQSTKLNKVIMDVALSAPAFKPGETIEIAVTLRNTGKKVVYFQSETAPIVLMQSQLGLKMYPPAGSSLEDPIVRCKATILPLAPNETYEKCTSLVAIESTFKPGHYVLKVAMLFDDQYEHPEKGRFKHALKGMLMSKNIDLLIVP